MTTFLAVLALAGLFAAFGLIQRFRGVRCAGDPDDCDRPAGVVGCGACRHAPRSSESSHVEN
ncbi:MAG: hypothetical protein ACYTG6_10850 [Planctomycetota bacterium]|jgi:hypothetical protein